MYVCICHAVTDSTIRQAAAEGVGNLSDLTVRTGCSSSCGQCAEMAQQILTEKNTLSLGLPMASEAIS